MSAWEDPRAIAPRRLKRSRANRDVGAEALLDRILAILAEPDRDMIDAGLAALRERVPYSSARRDVVEAVWRAMFAKIG